MKSLPLRLAAVPRAELSQFVRFLAASCLSASITLGLPIVLHELFGLVEEIAVAIPLALATLVNFITLRRLVFRSIGHLPAEAVRFVIMTLCFRITEYICFLLLHSLLGLHYVLALAIILPTAMASKFLTLRGLVFRSKAA